MLAALWLVFAAAAVGVGFGAAGLVGDPFTEGDVATSTAGAASGPAGTPVPAGTPSPTGSSPSGSAPSSTPPSGSADGRPVTRTQITRGGQVTGTCQDGLVRLGAAPEIGWEMDDLDAGAREEARARFERVDDGDGKVEVRATCVDGTPTFAVRDDTSGSDGSRSDESDESDD